MTSFTKPKCFLLNSYQLYILPEIFDKLGLFKNQVTTSPSSIPGVILKNYDYTEEEINTTFGLIYAKYLGDHTYANNYNYFTDAVNKIDIATLLKICYLLQELELTDMKGDPIYDILGNVAKRQKKLFIQWYTSIGSYEDFSKLKTLIDYNRLDEKYIKYFMRQFISPGGLSRYIPGETFRSAIDETIKQICEQYQLPFDTIMDEYPEYYHANREEFRESCEPIINLLVDKYLYAKQ